MITIQLLTRKYSLRGSEGSTETIPLALETTDGGVDTGSKNTITSLEFRKILASLKEDKSPQEILPITQTGQEAGKSQSQVSVVVNRRNPDGGWSIVDLAKNHQSLTGRDPAYARIVALRLNS